MRILFSLFILSFCLRAHACAQALANAFFENPVENKHRISKLAVALVAANPALFLKRRFRTNPQQYANEIAIRILRISSSHRHDRWPLFVVRSEITFRGSEARIDTLMRSNGYAAFLGSTCLNTEPFDEISNQTFPFFCVHHEDSSDQILSIDQATVVLNSLPPTVTLSRTLSEQEKEHWKNGTIDQIPSFQYVFSSPQTIAPRTRFALNYFEFQNEKPIQVQFPLKKLRTLHSQKRLQVNTYQPTPELPAGIGMPPSAQTSFGLEVEIVVLGVEGRRTILPEMQKALAEHSTPK